MAPHGPQSKAPGDGRKVAVIEYRRPGVDGPSTLDYWPGGQVRPHEENWICVHGIHGNIAFYPKENVVRAWNEPAEEST